MRATSARGSRPWLRAGIIRKVICSYIGGNEDLHTRMASGEVQVEITPQGTLAERMRAAGAGIAAFFTPTGAGTVVEDGKEAREFDGRRYILERALSADVALVRAAEVGPIRQPAVLAHRAQLQPRDGVRGQADDRRVRRARRQRHDRSR